MKALTLSYSQEAIQLMKSKLLLGLTVAAMLTLAGCNPTNTSSKTADQSSTADTDSLSDSTASSATTPVTTPDTSSSTTLPDEDHYELKIMTASGASSTLSLSYNKDETAKGTVQLSVTNNGDDAFDEEIVTAVAGDEGVIASVTLDTAVDYLFNIEFGESTGTATVTFSLKDHEEVEPVVATITTTENFFSTTITRADNTEEDGVMTFGGGAGQQHTAVAKKAGTVWALTGTMNFPASLGEAYSLGIGSFLDNGDHAIWAGVKNFDGAPSDDQYGIYIRSFYDGWGTAKLDGAPVPAFRQMDFAPSVEGTSSVTFTLIRDELNYYYEIGGYHGKFADPSNTPVAEATYPGFYSQETDLTITDYSVTYDEAEVDALIEAGYTGDIAIEAGCFVNPSVTEFVVGTSRTFVWSTGPDYATEGLALRVNDEYKDHVTITGNVIELAKDAPEGTMVIELVAGESKVLDTVSVPVVTKSSGGENDQLVAKGGVILNEDGSVTFPENMMGVNGVGNETAYDATPEYGVDLKQQVLGGDFSIEFDVSGYKANAVFPKLMVSIGGNWSQFYVVYKTDGTSRIETMSQSVESNANQWNNSSFFADFDQTATHHFKIESKDGLYNVYLDHSETPLEFNMDNQARHLAVPTASIYATLPIRISTNGVSATVSNIVVTTGSIDDLADTYIVEDGLNRVVDNEDGSYTFKFTDGGWGVRYDRVRAFALKELTGLVGPYTISYDVQFAEGMKDGKFIIQIGDHGFHLVNAAGGGNKIEHDGNGSFGPNSNTFTIGTDLVYHATLVNDGEGNVTFSAKGTSGNTASFTVTGVTWQTAYFWAFNETGEDSGKTATLSNLVVTRGQTAE